MTNSKYKFLKTNLNVTVNVEEKDTLYKSLIQEINNEYFIIQEPVYKRFVLPLQKDQKVTLGVFTENDRYTFEATVLGKKLENNLVLYILSMPENVKKHERRDFVRVEVSIDVEFEILKEKPKDLNKLKGLQLSHKALALDLSGGGIMLKVKKKLPEKLYVFMKFNIGSKDNLHNISVCGKIMRSYTQNRYGVKRHLLGVRFCEIDERTRDKIISYVFDKMLENIRKT